MPKIKHYVKAICPELQYSVTITSLQHLRLMNDLVPTSSSSASDIIGPGHLFAWHSCSHQYEDNDAKIP
jgi:hypothetical protein